MITYKLKSIFPTVTISSSNFKIKNINCSVDIKNENVKAFNTINVISNLNNVLYFITLNFKIPAMKFYFTAQNTEIIVISYPIMIKSCCKQRNNTIGQFHSHFGLNWFTTPVFSVIVANIYAYFPRSRAVVVFIFYCGRNELQREQHFTRDCNSTREPA